MSKALEILRKWAEVVHSALFPRRCAGCQTKGTYLCPACDDAIPHHGHWEREAIFSAVSYSHPAVRQLVWLLKYRGIREVATIFAGWLYDCLLDELTELAAYREQGGKIIIVPVPLSIKRLRERGYNQAEEIARCLTALEPKIFRLDTTNLIKTKHTQAQVKTHGRAERLANLHGAFHLKNRRAFRGRTIILLDDVATTGATLAETARVLLSARPRRLIKVTVAG